MAQMVFFTLVHLFVVDFFNSSSDGLKLAICFPKLGGQSLLHTDRGQNFHVFIFCPSHLGERGIGNCFLLRQLLVNAFFISSLTG